MKAGVKLEQHYFIVAIALAFIDASSGVGKRLCSITLCPTNKKEICGKLGGSIQNHLWLSRRPY